MAMAATPEAVLALLSDGTPRTALAIARALGGKHKRDVNPLLHDMKTRNLLLQADQLWFRNSSVPQPTPEAGDELLPTVLVARAPPSPRVPVPAPAVPIPTRAPIPVSPCAGVPATPTEAITSALQRLLAELPEQSRHLQEAHSGQMTPRQRHLGRFIAYALLHMIQLQGAAIVASMLTADRTTLVPGVMHQAVVMDAELFDCRVHFFVDATETLIHDHKLRFMSFMLQGRYWHTVYNVTPRSAEDAHSARCHALYARREGTNGALERVADRDRAVVAALAHTHAPAALPVEIHEDTFHTVRVVPSRAAAPPPITLVVRFKPPPGAPRKEASSFLVPADAPPPTERMEQRRRVGPEEVSDLQGRLLRAVEAWVERAATPPAQDPLEVLVNEEQRLYREAIANSHCRCPTCDCV